MYLRRLIWVVFMLLSVACGQKGPLRLDSTNPQVRPQTPEEDQKKEQQKKLSLTPESQQTLEHSKNNSKDINP